MRASRSPEAPTPRASLRVLCMTSSWPRQEGDLAGCFVQRWAEQLVSHGAQLRVLRWAERHEPARASGALTDALSVRSVTYAPAQAQLLFYGAGAPEALEQDPKRWALLPNALAAMAAASLSEARRFKPDLIVGHWLAPAGLLARALGSATGVPSLIVTHSAGIHLLRSPGMPGPLARALAACAASGPMTFVSQPMRERFEVLHPATRSAILPMGFDPLTGQARVEALAGAQAPGQDWLVLGRLTPLKRVAQVIEAFGESALGPGVTLHVAGDGPERPACEAAARAARARGASVILHGVVLGHAKQALLARCGVMVLGSGELASGRQEGLPVSLLEGVDAGMTPLLAHSPSAQALLLPQSLPRLGPDPRAWPQVMRELAGSSQAQRDAWLVPSRARVAQMAWPVLSLRWAELLWRAAHKPHDNLGDLSLS